MEDSWRLAGECHHIGTRKSAKKHLANALAATAPSSTLQRTILQINLHAVSAHSHTAPPPPLPTSSSKSPAIRLLAEEAFLTATYNATLQALRRDPRTSLHPLREAVKRVPAVLHFLRANTPDAEFPSFQRPKPVDLPIDRLLQQPELIDPDLRSPARRWADAAATCHELLTAGSMLQHRRSQTTTSQSLRRFINALSTPDSSEPSQHYDQHTARADYLQTLDSPHFADAARLQGPDEELHLPFAYLTAVKQLLARDPAARRLLEICASRSYRLSDALSLLARLEHGDQALQAWQRAFAVDVRRPAGLWLAAREFGRVGRYAQQAQILACLEQLLDGDLRGYEGVKIENFSVMEDTDDLNFENVVTKPAVVAERARSLAGAGEWDDVKKLLDGVKDDISARADVLRDRAQCAVCQGDISEGLSLAETAKVAAAGPTDRAGALLVQAEGLLRMEQVEKAREKVMEAFREAKLGMVGMSWEAEPPRLLRGVCFHNLAVLHYCVNEKVAADECFAAAETAFRKCEEECREIAARMRVLSAFGRCFVMWGRGMKEDAAEYWRAVRDLTVDDMEEGDDGDGGGGDDVRPDSHVVCDVHEEILERFDRICLEVCREEEKRKEMERMLEEVEKEWPLGQKRRRGN